jgi:hypothetical protein
MNSTFRTIIIVLLTVALSAAVFLGGVFFGAGRFGFNMTLAPGASAGVNTYSSYGNMMGGSANQSYNSAPYGYGPGMMGGYGGGSTSAKPISVEDAKKVAEAYLARINDADLQLKEIMIFDNGGYAAIQEKSTGVGAFELLIDPVSLTAYPEYGPNMMWNLKYGMISGNAGYHNYGMMNNGMMGRWYSNTPTTSVSAEMPVSAKQAADYAQKYLDNALPGVKVSDEITPFYGYYTIDLERDGKIVGMLSVNGYSGQVFLHTWHGTYITTSE